MDTDNAGRRINVNPKRDTKCGAVTAFILMDALPEHAREVARIKRRELVGSGAKFRNRDTLFMRSTPCLENGTTAFVTGLVKDEVAHGSTDYIAISGKDGTSAGIAHTGSTSIDLKSAGETISRYSISGK